MVALWWCYGGVSICTQALIFDRRLEDVNNSFLVTKSFRSSNEKDYMKIL